MLKFNKDIKTLKDVDLPRYKDLLFDKLLGVISSEERRIQLLDKIDQIDQEIQLRKN